MQFQPNQPDAEIDTNGAAGWIVTYELLALLLRSSVLAVLPPEPTTVIKKLKETIAGFETKHAFEDAILPALRAQPASRSDEARAGSPPIPRGRRN
jgi:hypothetical protein